MQYYSVLLPLALILALSKVLSKLSAKLNMPQVVGMLLTGIIIGLINYIPNQNILNEVNNIVESLNSDADLLKDASNS